MSKKIVHLFVFVSFFALTLASDVSYPPQPPITDATTTPTTTTTSTTTTKPTTTTTSETTTTKPTTTTPPDTTTSPNPNTTTNTPPTTTSPVTTPAPPPAPKPEVGTWKVVDPKTNKTCIMADMAIQLNVSYDRVDTKKIGYATIIVPANATNATGDCSSNVTQTITLTWLPKGVTNMFNTIKLTFNKNESIKIVEVARFDVVIQANVTEFVGIANFTTMTLVNNETEFSTSVGMSYLCSKTQPLNLTKDGTITADIEVSHLRVEAFHDSPSDKFNAAKDCEPSSATDYIPIGVGCGLVALVAIVLIAYLVGRRRSQARGYLSM